MNGKIPHVPALLSSALLLTACGSATESTTTTTPGATIAPSSTTSDVTRDLAVTPEVRQSLLDAAVASHQLPPSDYVGLVAGTTYYAFDPSTGFYCAAAGLSPSPKSLRAQVGTQDDGAYNLFTRAAGTSTWTVYSDGLGAAQSSTRPIVIPAAVLAAWNWKVDSCQPPSGACSSLRTASTVRCRAARSIVRASGEYSTFLGMGIRECGPHPR